MRAQCTSQRLRDLAFHPCTVHQLGQLQKCHLHVLTGLHGIHPAWKTLTRIHIKYQKPQLSGCSTYGLPMLQEKPPVCTHIMQQKQRFRVFSKHISEVEQPDQWQVNSGVAWAESHKEAALLCVHHGNCRGRIVSINSLCHVILLFQTREIAI